MDYRIKLYDVVGSHTEEEWQATLLEYNYECANCHSRNNLTVDHIKPISKGGTDFISNIQPLCRKCNSIKGDSYPSRLMNPSEEITRVTSYIGREEYILLRVKLVGKDLSFSEWLRRQIKTFLDEE
jgi:hypothetical protein